MAQQLRALAVLPEVLGSILSACMLDHNSLYQYAYGIDAFFLVYRYMQA